MNHTIADDIASSCYAEAAKSEIEKLGKKSAHCWRLCQAHVDEQFSQKPKKRPDCIIWHALSKYLVKTHALNATEKF